MTDTIQITRTPKISDALDYIKSKYFLLDDEEIIKMAISNQYNLINQSADEDEMDETEYLMSTPANRKSMQRAMNQDVSTARHFNDVDALKKALNFVE
jgi:hypothetical protein